MLVECLKEYCISLKKLSQLVTDVKEDPKRNCVEKKSPNPLKTEQLCLTIGSVEEKISICVFIILMMHMFQCHEIFFRQFNSMPTSHYVSHDLLRTTSNQL